MSLSTSGTATATREWPLMRGPLVDWASGHNPKGVPDIHIDYLEAQDVAAIEQALSTFHGK